MDINTIPQQWFSDDYDERREPYDVTEDLVKFMLVARDEFNELLEYQVRSHYKSMTGYNIGDNELRIDISVECGIEYTVTTYFRNEIDSCKTYTAPLRILWDENAISELAAEKLEREQREKDEAAKRLKEAEKLREKEAETKERELYERLKEKYK